MTRSFSTILIALVLTLLTQELHSQFNLKFGDITVAELSDKTYKPDPGAVAVVLSDVGVVTINYLSRFYVEFERDVRIKIVNSNGYDHADIEIPASRDDQFTGYRASSFNLRNGEKVESKLLKKNFIIEQETKSRKILKFNFPDVHEGTVIEYSYVERMEGDALSALVPWSFQTTIPVKFSSLSIIYPEYFIYKNFISGNPLIVQMDVTSSSQYIAGTETQITHLTWYANDVPAFIKEPYMKSTLENLTRITFELASVNFPNSSMEEITPTYKTLNKKLLERDDFGRAMSGAGFLKKLAEKVTEGLTDDLSKLKAVHKFVSEKMLWNGDEDFTASSTLKQAFTKEKGNDADINMILIVMLRDLGIKANPVILSTRSNGSIKEFFAMIQQFNYLVAYVTIGNQNYLVDATDPLRPFNLLPFDCLNGKGRLISEYESWFVDLKNSEMISKGLDLNLSLDDKGMIQGYFRKRNSGYAALEIRKTVKMEGEEGYTEKVRDENHEYEFPEFKLLNISARDSDIIETGRIRIAESIIQSGDMLVLNPYFSFTSNANPFISPERSFTVDFGCPIEESFTETLQIPDGYIISEIPDNVTFNSGKDDAKYVFTCSKEGNKLTVQSSLRINKTIFTPAEYSELRSFYSKMLRSQGNMVILKKKM